MDSTHAADHRRDAPSVGDMPPDEFLAHGRAAVDWIAEYLRSVGDYPVLAEVRPGQVKASLAAEPPVDGEPFEQIMQDFQERILPGITHWNHPGFFGYFAITGSAPGIIGEMLTAAMNVNAMVWQSSPSATELEELTADWLRQLLGLPTEFDGVINDTASHSSLYALAAAREVAIPEAREHGLNGGPRGRVYASEHAHSSIDKAVVTLGFGRQGTRHVQADELFQMRPGALRAAIEEDEREGIRPVAVCAVAGTTSTTSFDPLEEIAEICRESGIWLHVDAAYAGPAAIAPELRPLFAGWEHADSIVVNPHKWLFTPIDCSLLYCRRPEALQEVFSMTPAYLRTREEMVARNLMDYGVALGRRFRSLKLWFVLRYFGSRGIADRIREHCRLARRFAGHVSGANAWRLVAPTPLSTVVFRFAPAGPEEDVLDELNRKLLDAVNESGESFLSPTVLEGRVALRLSIGNLRTQEEHVDRAWEALVREADQLMAERGAE